MTCGHKIVNNINPISALLKGNYQLKCLPTFYLKPKNSVIFASIQKTQLNQQLTKTVEPTTDNPTTDKHS